MNRNLASIFILAALAVQATASHAAILLDNTSSAQPATSTKADPTQNYGVVFTPSANDTLTTLTVALADLNTGSNTINLSLWNVDGANKPTGAALATATEAVTVGSLASPDVVVLNLGSNATGSWDVTAGTTYALSFYGETNTQARTWTSTSSGVAPTGSATYVTWIYGTSTAGWTTLGWKPWIQLSSTPVAVPEPSTWALAVAGVTCSAWGMARRRRRAAGSVREA